MALKRANAPAPDRGESPRIPQPPLSEERVSVPGSFYLHVSDPAHAAALFRAVERELSEMGFSCSHGSLQADPHPTLSVVGNFEVYIKARRQPELFGTVTAYGTLGAGSAAKVFKLDAVYPSDEDVFRRAVGAAVEKTLPDFSARGSEREIGLAISKEPEHTFLRAKE